MHEPARIVRGGSVARARTIESASSTSSTQPGWRAGWLEGCRRILDSVVGSRGRVATRILQADGRGRETDRCSVVLGESRRLPFPPAVDPVLKHELQPSKFGLVIASESGRIHF
jgi:hypothetical protein